MSPLAAIHIGSLVTLSTQALVNKWRLKLPFRPQGMYEVLAYDAVLDIHDAQGYEATYRKRQKVRFLQDNIIAYPDVAWGEGNIFADYQCSPGIPVDRYRDGNRWRVLISLRESKSRGQLEDFHIERQIENGFTRATEYFQAKIDHPTRRLSLSIIFPKKRPSLRVILIEQNANRTTELGPKHFQTLPTGRQQVTWETTCPRQFEMYTLRWKW